MLRLFGQQYTIRNLFYILTEGIFLHMSVLLYSGILLGSSIDLFYYGLQLKAGMMVNKFRSMGSDAEKESGPFWAKKNDVRITRIGKFIRKSRIDEIPQLLNVLKSNMSMIGPRPKREFFVNHLANVIPYYSERFSIKRGITGWAQVC